MPARIDWTEDLKVELSRLLAQGLTYRQAAERMGIRRDQAKSAAHAHDLGPRRPHRKWREWGREECDTLERLLADGLTYPEICQRMGLGLNEVKGAAQRLGLMDPSRVGQHRKRSDWPEIDRIVTDCIEAQLMTIPQTHRHLAALGYEVGLGTLYRRIADNDPELRARAKRNAKRRKVVVGQRVSLAKQARRRHEQRAA